MRVNINSFNMQKKIHLKFASDINYFCINIPVLWLILMHLLNGNTQFWWCSKILNFSNLLLFSGHSCIDTWTAHQAFLIFLQQFSTSFCVFSILFECSETIFTRLLNDGVLWYSSLALSAGHPTFLMDLPRWTLSGKLSARNYLLCNNFHEKIFHK